MYYLKAAIIMILNLLLLTGCDKVNTPVSPAHLNHIGGSDSEISIVMVHGLYHNSEAFHFITPAFIEAGFNVYTLDLRGHHEQPRITAHHEIGFEDYLEDVEDALNKIPGDKILIGHSLGSLLAMSTLPRSDLKAMVLLSVTLPEVLRDNMPWLIINYPLEVIKMALFQDPAQLYHEPSVIQDFFLTGETSESALKKFTNMVQEQREPMKLFVDLQKLSSASLLSVDIRDQPIPILIVNGELDMSVTTDGLAILKELTLGEVITIPNQGHDFILGESSAEISKTIVDWLQKEIPAIDPANL